MQHSNQLEMLIRRYKSILCMENKKLGIILIAISILFIIPLIVFKIQVNNLTDAVMIATGGSCIKEGKCIHEQSEIPIYIGVAIIFITMALGIYLLAFDRSQKYTENIQKELVSTLKETKKKQDKDENFEFLLKALNEDEKKVMMSVKEQDGIEQSTLRIRTNLSKTKLSVVLTELEKKNLIKKVPEGKKNKIYLKSAF